MNQALFHGLVVICYVLSAFAYWMQVIFSDRSLARLGLWLLGAGVLLQTGLLVHSHLPLGEVGHHGEGDFYYAASWILGLLLLFVPKVRAHSSPDSGAPLFLIPLAAVLMIRALTHPQAYHVGTTIETDPWALIHFLFMSLAFAIFAVGFLLGIGFLLQRSYLKNHRFGFFSRWLPPLEVADEIHAKASMVGFLVLSVGMIAGAVLSLRTRGTVFSSDLRQIAALVIWVFYALFLNVRVREGRHGRKGILLSVLGFLIVVLAFMAIQHGI